MSRRYGDGSIYQRKSDDRWTASFRLPDGTRKYVYGATRQEAKEKLRAAQQLAERGQLVASDRQRLADYLEYWLSAHSMTVKPITGIQYASEIRAHINPLLGAIPLQKLTSRHIHRLICAMGEAGNAPGTVKGVYALLNTALKDAVNWKLLGHNPCTGVKLPRADQDEVIALDRDQAQALLDAVKGTKLAGLVPLALATGLRRGELLALRWSDIDFERGLLHVQRTVIYVNGVGFQEVDPKTKSSRRTVTLAPFALAALREHRTQQKAARLAAAAWQERNLVFCNAKGGYLPFSTLDYRFKKLCERAALPPMHFHGLRHSCATLLIAMGVHPKVVQEILGHSSIKTTMDKYGHVLPGMQDEAMQSLDRFLQG